MLRGTASVTRRNRGAASSEGNALPVACGQWPTEKVASARSVAVPTGSTRKA